MSGGGHLNEHDRKLWDFAMTYPIPKGTKWNGFESIEDGYAHASMKCTDGQIHTFYLHAVLYKKLKALDESIDFTIDHDPPKEPRVL